MEFHDFYNEMHGCWVYSALHAIYLRAKIAYYGNPTIDLRYPLKWLQSQLVSVTVDWELKCIHLKFNVTHLGSSYKIVIM